MNRRTLVLAALATPLAALTVRAEAAPADDLWHPITIHYDYKTPTYTDVSITWLRRVPGGLVRDLTIHYADGEHAHSSLTPARGWYAPVEIPIRLVRDITTVRTPTAEERRYFADYDRGFVFGQPTA
jgi:hypothetical protein